MYDPTKGMFGFQEGMEEQEEDEDQELFFIDAQPNEPEIQPTAAVGEPPQPQPEPQELLQPSASFLVYILRHTLICSSLQVCIQLITKRN